MPCIVLLIGLIWCFPAKDSTNEAIVWVLQNDYATTCYGEEQEPEEGAPIVELFAALLMSRFNIELGQAGCAGMVCFVEPSETSEFLGRHEEIVFVSWRTSVA